MPSLARVPLPGLRIGLGEPPGVVLVAIAAFFPVSTTVFSAITHLDQSLVEVGRAHGRRGLGLFTHLLLALLGKLSDGVLALVEAQIKSNRN